MPGAEWKAVCLGVMGADIRKAHFFDSGGPRDFPKVAD